MSDFGEVRKYLSLIFTGEKPLLLPGNLAVLLKDNANLFLFSMSANSKKINNNLRAKLFYQNKSKKFKGVN